MWWSSGGVTGLGDNRRSALGSIVAFRTGFPALPGGPEPQVTYPLPVVLAVGNPTWHERGTIELNPPQVRAMGDSEIMTIQEVATLLRISERTIYAMATEGRLPGAVKVGRSWRVLRPKLIAWLEENSASPPSRRDDDGGETT
jgi:excisionase family DNA binding protein